MKKVVVVNGYPESGKTLFEEYIANYQKTMIYSSIDCVKEYAIKYFDWDGKKTEYWRRFFSQLKKMLVEKFDYIFKDVSSKVLEFQESDCEFLMIDSREPAEIDRFKKEFGAITLFVTSDRCNKVMSNESDANVENYVYDYYIDNSSTLDDLKQKALEFIEKLN